MWFKTYGLWVALPVAVTAATGVATADIRWVMVTMMLLLVMFPMLMSWIYIYYMITPEARYLVLLKQVELTGNTLRVDYLPDDRYADDADYPGPSPFPTLAPETFTVKRLVKWHGHLAVVIDAPRLSFVLVPLGALAAPLPGPVDNPDSDTLEDQTPQL